VDVVIPTHNRAAMVCEKVRWLFRNEVVRRVIVVADGCTDSTVTALNALGDSRLEVLENLEAMGPAGARNRGIDVAREEWVVLMDDDDRHPDDFIGVLLATAVASAADIVGAPWLNPRIEHELDAEVARRRQEAGPLTIDDVSRFPGDRWVVTPWLPQGVLVRRDVLAAVRFDEGFKGNFWREETDFFVAANRAGFRTVMTSETFSWSGPRGTGGISRDSSLKYEWSAVRNNWRFLRKHGRWLSENQGFAHPRVEQARFIARRGRAVVRGATFARARRVRAAVGRPKAT